ncbi:hypothetical protein Pfo_027238 [Paulownia fortunei]|nr:hypothetical protein Pfo_027238 [Paulownia fortunei]
MNPYPVFLTPYNLEPSNNGSSSSSISENDLSCSQDHRKTYNMIRWKSGKRVDPRLLALLESFGEIYVDRHEFFERIFHGDHEELFKKIGDLLKRKKHMKKSGSMKRSMSMRAIRQRGVEEESEDGLRVERFKVRTPNVIVAGEDDGKGAQTTKGSNGSK